MPAMVALALLGCILCMVHGAGCVGTQFSRAVSDDTTVPLPFCIMAVW